MKPRISLITICVDDFERSLRFYRDGLGFDKGKQVGEWKTFDSRVES
jgi:uncharacterized protein